eukprot:5635836-Pleurochrysis_carterae.AAC.1
MQWPERFLLQGACFNPWPASSNLSPVSYLSCKAAAAPLHLHNALLPLELHALVCVRACAG